MPRQQLASSTGSQPPRSVRPFYRVQLSACDVLLYCHPACNVRGSHSLHASRPQAAANAKHNQGATKTKLVVSEAMADQGPMYKRFQERAQGRAYRINKPTFHLTLKVEERA